MWKHLISSALLIMITVAAITVSTQAAFTAQATISGISFSTGNAALNLFGNLAYTNAGNNGNLTYTLSGPSFQNISPNWTHDYFLKYFNNGSINLNTSLRVVVVNDPAGLANHLKAETWLWNDIDGNGGHSGPDTYSLLAPAQTLQNLTISPAALGQMNVHQARGILLRFTTGEMPSETQASSANFNFVIEGTTDGVTP